jgi:lysozyme family protein
MKYNLDFCMDKILSHEGGYVNHPKDPGGPTNLGVTLAVAKAFGLDVDGDGDVDIIDIKNLRREDAIKVFKAKYWDLVWGDRLPSGVDLAVFDFAINSGPSRAVIFVQELVGVAPDGKMGPITFNAIVRADPRDLINKLCDKRQAFLERLSTFSTFGKGWTRRVATVRKDSLNLVKTSPKEEIKPEVELSVKSDDLFTIIIRILIKLLTRA